MATLASIQNKLQVKVFDKLGSSITVKALTTSTDKWGDQTTTGTVSTAVTAVPFNFLKNVKTFNPFGVAQEGEIDMVMPYGTDIQKGYVVTFDSTDFDVFDVEKFPYADGNIAFLVRLKEQLS
jgi:hypothetical protein